MHKVPPRYQAARLDCAEIAGYIRNPSAVQRARLGVAARVAVLFGVSGAGKTTLAVALGHAMAERRDVNAMFVAAPDLDAAPKEAKLGQGEPELVYQASRVPVLVLDELGAEPRETGAVGRVLHARHDRDRWVQTVIALALPPDEAARFYADGVVRRLLEGALLIRCDGTGQPPIPARGFERLERPPRKQRPQAEPNRGGVPTELMELLNTLEGAGPAFRQVSLSAPHGPRLPRPPHDEDPVVLERARVLRAQAAELLAAERTSDREINPEQETGT